MLLIATAKRSPQYRAVRDRVKNPCPRDTWYQDELGFIVFDIRPGPREDAANTQTQLVFALAADSGALIAARIIQVDGHGGEGELIDLLDLELP